MDHKEGSIKESTILSSMIILPFMLFNISSESLGEVKIIAQIENNLSGILNKTKVSDGLEFSSDSTRFYPPTRGNTYYVGPDGDDSRSKSDAQSYNTPWRTIRKACNSIEPGDKVIVKDGIYKAPQGERLYAVDLRLGGTEDNWIIFKAENRWCAKIDGEDNRIHFGWNFGDNANYVWVEGFEIFGFDFAGFWDNHDCHDIYLYNNHIHTIGRRLATEGDYKYGRCGIGIDRTSKNVTIDRNVIHNIGRIPHSYNEPHDYKNDHGIYAQGFGIKIQNNLIYDCPAGWSIKIDGNDFGFSENSHIIRDNIFALPSNPYREGHIRFYTNPACKYEPKNVIINNNIFYKPPHNTAISIRKDYSTVIKNNIMTCENLIPLYFKDTQRIIMEDNVKLEIE